MTETYIPETAGWDDDQAVEVVPETPERVPDFVLAGRTSSSGQFLAGLVAAAQLDTVGRVEKLAADLFPDADPALVQAVWDRALAVGLRAGQFAGAPRFHRDRLEGLQARLTEAGFRAMGGMVGRSVTVVTDRHPADEEAPLGHPNV